MPPNPREQTKWQQSERRTNGAETRHGSMSFKLIAEGVERGQMGTRIGLGVPCTPSQEQVADVSPRVRITVERGTCENDCFGEDPSPGKSRRI